MITNLHYQLILVFLYSGFAAWVAVEYSIVRLKKYHYVVPDMHKFGKPKIPVMGGIPIFIGIIISIAHLLMLKEGIGDLFIFSYYKAYFCYKLTRVIKYLLEPSLCISLNS